MVTPLLSGSTKGNQQTEAEFCRGRSSQARGRIRSQKPQNNRAINRLALPELGWVKTSLA